MNKPKSWDNADVAHFLQQYRHAAEVCALDPRIDDVFSGVLAAKTPGDTSTRSLSRKTLFRVLQCCPTISVAEIDDLTHGELAARSLRGYAAHARVASRFLKPLIGPTKTTDDAELYADVSCA